MKTCGSLLKTLEKKKRKERNVNSVGIWGEGMQTLGRKKESIVINMLEEKNCTRKSFVGRKKLHKDVISDVFIVQTFYIYRKEEESSR